MGVTAAGFTRAVNVGDFPFDDVDDVDGLTYSIIGYSSVSGIVDRKLKSTLTSLEPAGVDTIAALRSYPTERGGVFLSEIGREGFWSWISGNQSANVEPQGDPDNHYAFYVAPINDLTGASGAWKRNFSGNIRSSWAGFGNDWSKIRQFINKVADLHPHAIVELDAITYEVSGGAGGSYQFYDISVVGQGVNQTFIKQVGAQVSVPIISVSSTSANGKSSDVNLSKFTVDANDLVTAAAVEFKGSNRILVEDIDVVGWRTGITVFSVRENTGAGIAASAATDSKFRRVKVYNPGATIGHVYPFQFNAPWGAPQVYDVDIEDIFVEGVGGYYDGVSTAGTADQVTFQNCKKVRGRRIFSTLSGELGLNVSRGSEDVRLEYVKTTFSDADGVNIGSGQFVLELADTNGFVMGELVEVNNDPLFSGEIAGIDDTRLLIGNATINTDNALPVAGNTVNGLTSGTSKSLIEWKGGAHDIRISNIISYGNSRDEKPTGNLYAGVKLNLATNVVTSAANCRELSPNPTQQYGYYSVNSEHTYSGVDCRDNLSSNEPFILGKSLVYPLFSNTSTTNLTLTRGSDITVTTAGVVILDDEIAFKVKPNTGLEQTITDILAQPGSSLVEGRLAIFTPSADTQVLRFQAGTRLRIPSDITLRTIGSSLIFQYRDDGAGYWTLFADSRREDKTYNYDSVSVANTDAETEIGTGSAYMRLLGKARFKIAGVITNTSGANRTINFKLKIGTDVLYSGTTSAIINGAQPRPYQLVFDIYRVSDTLQKIVLNGRIGANAASKMGTDEIIANVVDYAESTIDLSAAGTAQIKMFTTLSAANANFTLTNEISEFSSTPEG